MPEKKSDKNNTLRSVAESDVTAVRRQGAKDHFDNLLNAARYLKSGLSHPEHTPLINLAGEREDMDDIVEEMISLCGDRKVPYVYIDCSENWEGERVKGIPASLIRQISQQFIDQNVISVPVRTPEELNNKIEEYVEGGYAGMWHPVVYFFDKFDLLY